MVRPDSSLPVSCAVARLSGSSGERPASGPKAAGADEYEVVADAERGVLSRRASRLGGEDFDALELEEIRFGEGVLTSRERLPWRQAHSLIGWLVYRKPLGPGWGAKPALFCTEARSEGTGISPPASNRGPGGVRVLSKGYGFGEGGDQ